MLTSLANAMKQAFNRSNPNSLPSLLAAFAFGDFLRTMPTQLRGAVPAADPYSGATVALVLPDDAKASSIFYAYARAGAGTLGTLSVQPAGTALAAGQCAVGRDGNILFYAADAWTSVDVRYLPKEEDVVELILPVAAGVVTIPATFAASSLLEVQRQDTSTAALVVTVEAATNTTTGTACLNLAKTQVLLDSADGATSVRVKLGVACATNRNALLEAASTAI